MKKDDSEWMAEAVLRFLEGPEYRTPLLDFVDAQCLIFEDDDENKLEYTKIHRDFKARVERLITNFLRDIGVKPDEFQSVIASAIEKKRELSSFLVASILAVDDFIQFKAMMLRHSAALTEEVLSQLPANPDSSLASSSSCTRDVSESSVSEGGGDISEEEMQAAIRMSQEQFEMEKAALVRRLGIADVTSYITRNMTPDEELAMAVAESLRQEFNPNNRPKSRGPIDQGASSSSQVNANVTTYSSASQQGLTGSGKTKELLSDGGQSFLSFKSASAREQDAAPAYSATGGNTMASAPPLQSQSTSLAQSQGADERKLAPNQALSVSEEEVERRREYLKMQKARLVAKKTQMRARQKAKAVPQKPDEIYHQAAPAKFEDDQSEVEAMRANMSISIGEQMKLRMAEAARKAFKGLDIR